jgi:hypothetical protein
MAPSGLKGGVTRQSIPVSATTKGPLPVPLPFALANRKAFEKQSPQTDRELVKAAARAIPLPDTVVKDPAPAKATTFLLPSSMVMREAKEQRGRYSGKVLGMDETYVYQDTGLHTVTRHRRAVFEASLPSLEGRSILVQYKDGNAAVTDIAQVRSKGIGR